MIFQTNTKRENKTLASPGIALQTANKSLIKFSARCLAEVSGELI